MCRLEAWVFKGVHEAVGKRYLKSAAFIVVETPRTSRSRRIPIGSSARRARVLTPRQTFTPGGSERCTLGDLRAELVRGVDIVRFLTSALPSLSSAATYFTMRLSYNTLAPPDYMPPYFRACEDSELDFSGRAARTLKISDLHTSFHLCALLFKGPEFIPQEVETGESTRGN